MSIVPTKDASKECELSLKPAGYLDMDSLDDAMKEVSSISTIYYFSVLFFHHKQILIKLGMRQIDTSLTGVANNRNPAVFECLPVPNLRTICDCLLVVFPAC